MNGFVRWLLGRFDPFRDHDTRLATLERDLRILNGNERDDRTGSL